MHRLRAIGILCLVAVAASCASLRAPSPGGSHQAGDVEENPSASPVSISPIEGRPNGLVLAVDGDGAPDGATTLELYRQPDDGDPELIHDIAVSEIAGRLPFDIVDSQVRPGGRYRYHAVLANEEGVVTASRSGWVTWTAPPPAARQVRASARFGDVIEVSWEAPRETGAVVFRRDVLADGSSFERVAELEPGFGARWFDRDVTPAGVWSYRVSLSRVDGGFVQYGPPSEEVYASTPEETR